jgi:DNA-binding IclR family transcriptional regulator
LEKFTDHTTTSVRNLRRELTEIKRNGLAFDREEHSLGICAVGAVLPSIYGDVLAVSIPVPTQRFTGEEERLGSALIECVEQATAWAGALPA